MPTCLTRHMLDANLLFTPPDIFCQLISYATWHLLTCLIRITPDGTSFPPSDGRWGSQLAWRLARQLQIMVLHIVEQMPIILPKKLFTIKTIFNFFPFLLPFQTGSSACLSEVDKQVIQQVIQQREALGNTTGNTTSNITKGSVRLLWLFPTSSWGNFV